MIRKALYEEYMNALEEFCRRGSTLDAIACGLSAMRLRPDCQRTRQLLLSAIRDSSDQPASGKELARLRRRKAKLDLALFREICASQVSPELFILAGDPSAVPDEQADPRHEELLQKFTRLRKRLECMRSTQGKELRERLEALVERLIAQEKTEPRQEEPPAPAPTAEDDLWGELSLEHELHNVGNDFYKIGRFTEALECYNLALEVRPDLLETYFNRSLAYVRLQRYTKAFEDMSKVIDLNPHLAEGYYTRGLIREYQQDYQKAIEDYEKTLEIDPEYKKAETQIEVARRKKAEAGAAVSCCTSDSSGDKYEGVISDFTVFIEKPECTFAEVGGCEKALRVLKRVGLYLTGSPILEEWGAIPPTGVILYGEPGVGKTHCIRALAGEVHCPVYAPPPTVLNDMWAGNTEKNIRGLWAAAEKTAPCIIYIDEIDGFCCSRRRMGEVESYYNKAVVTILHLMDNIRQKRARVVVIGTTNRVQDIDRAFLRPGRFYPVVEVPYPDVPTLAEILLIHLAEAEERAQRVNFLSDSLRRAVRADRQEWLKEAVAKASRDPSGIMDLARLCARKKMTGAEVHEIVRQTVDDRISAAHAAEAAGPGKEPNPIAIEDLRVQAVMYKRPEWFD